MFSYLAALGVLLHKAFYIQVTIGSKWLGHVDCGFLPIYINSNLFLISFFLAALIMLIIMNFFY
jgi:hypothetical protein